MRGKIKNIYFDMQKLGKKYNLLALNQRLIDKFGGRRQERY